MLKIAKVWDLGVEVFRRELSVRCLGGVRISPVSWTNFLLLDSGLAESRNVGLAPENEHIFSLPCVQGLGSTSVCVLKVFPNACLMHRASYCCTCMRETEFQYS